MPTESHSASATPAPSQAAKSAFEEIARRACYTNAAIRFYKRLAETEKKALGGNLKEALIKYSNAPKMWIKLYGGSRIRAVIEVYRSFNAVSDADAKWLLSEYGESAQIKSNAAEVAIEEKGLVINDFPRAVYWQGKSVRCDWNGQHNKCFEILVAAAKKAKSGQPLRPRDLGDDCDSKTISKRLSRLKNIPEFPADLGDLFTPDRSDRDLGSQRLNLPTALIHFFDTEAADYA